MTWSHLAELQRHALGFAAFVQHHEFGDHGEDMTRRREFTSMPFCGLAEPTALLSSRPTTSIFCRNRDLGIGARNQDFALAFGW